MERGRKGGPTDMRALAARCGHDDSNAPDVRKGRSAMQDRLAGELNQSPSVASRRPNARGTAKIAVSPHASRVGAWIGRNQKINSMQSEPASSTPAEPLPSYLAG